METITETIVTRGLSQSEDQALHKVARNGHSTRKVFIAVPIFWHVDPLFFKCALKLQQEMNVHGIDGVFTPYCGDSAIGRARNILTTWFLRSDCTHLLFVDSDLVFGVDQIKRIMSHKEEIVGGIYCKKQEGPVQLVINGLDSHSSPVLRDDGLLEVKYVGTGFIRIAREGFERMISVYGDEIGYKSDNDAKDQEWDFWQMGVYKYPEGGKRWLSEDWYFCQRAIDLGYKIWADRGTVLKHSGHVVYPLSYQEKELFKPDRRLEHFESPKDCEAGILEVFNGQYDFKMQFQTAPNIIDIGASVGAFAVWADWRWPGAITTCYEPDTGLFPVLQRNCDRIRASAINAAVGDVSLNRLFAGRINRLNSSQYRTPDQKEESMPISVVDPADLPFCDLIKIDTEGAEAFIVERLVNLPTFMIVEYHSKENHDRIIEYLLGKMGLMDDRPERPGYGVMAFKKFEV